MRLARLLHDGGLGLADAHAAVSELANKRVITVRVSAENLEEMLRQIRNLKLEAATFNEAYAFSSGD